MDVIPTSDALNQTTVMKQVRKLAECVNATYGGLIKNINLSEENDTYTMTITFADDTTQSIEWDAVAVGIEDITMSYSGGIYYITFVFSDGTSKSFALNVGNLVTEDEFTTALALKADVSTTYTKTEVDNALALKADKSDTYTKTETNSLLDGKENTISKSITIIPFKDMSTYGISLSAMDNSDDAHKAIRYGDMVVYNIAVRIIGTYISPTSTDDWMPLFELINFGKNNITPWVQSVKDTGGNSYLTINGNNLLFQNNKVYNIDVLYQVVIMLGDANRGQTKQALPDPKTIVNNINNR